MVNFVKDDRRDDGSGNTFTYEIYEADGKSEAVQFLDTKVVTRPMHYIEVHTPDGIFGRDIREVYQIHGDR